MMVLRGLIGYMVSGKNGAALSAATTKKKYIEKQRFSVKYLDGHVEEKEVVVGGEEYKKLVDYLGLNG